MIAIDGKPHDPQRATNYTYMGYTVGRWEGDTLVLDSIGFSDETWLGRGGWFHTDQMRVDREVHADREPAALRSDGRGPRGAGQAVGHARPDPAALQQPRRSSQSEEAARRANRTKSPRSTGTSCPF